MFLRGGGGFESAETRLPRPMSIPPIRIDAANQEQADQVWRALCEQTSIAEAEIWLGGRYLYHVVRRGAAMQTTLRAVQPAHTALPVVLGDSVLSRPA